MTHPTPARPVRRSRMRGLVSVLSASALLSLPAAAGAQSWRAQGAWVPDHLFGGLVGIEGRQPLGSPPPLPGAGGGPIVASTRDWIFTGMLGAGLNLISIRQHTVTPIFYAHAGVIYRTGSDLLSRAGLLGVGYMRARAVGPELFVEFEGVADLQAGVLHVPGGWKPGIGVTISLGFLGDIFSRG